MYLIRLIFFNIAAMFYTSATTAQTTIPLYVGTYTLPDRSEGIYLYDFDTAHGTATLRSTAITANPSFLTKSNNGKYLYAVNELGGKQATLSSFSIREGEIEFINKLPSEGGGSCHISVNGVNSLAVVSNYGGGNLTTFLIGADGRLKERLQVERFSGSGINKERQNQPHIHSSFFNATFDQLYVQDLGTDQIFVYDVDYKNEKPMIICSDTIVTQHGGGPRHIVVGLSEEILYVLTEMTADIEVYRKKKSGWTLEQKIGINEELFVGENGAAEIKTSPDGRFLYASNRGDANVITLFSIQLDGLLKKEDTFSVMGEGPRNFNITPDGSFLLVANQNSDEVVIFRRNTLNGKLIDTGNRIPVSTPSCILF